MPRYFFDCFDGRDFHADRHGIDLEDDDEAADQGTDLVQARLGENHGSIGMRAMTVMVRSATGAHVYSAHCTFHGLKMAD